jgi:hypothetical protein
VISSRYLTRTSFEIFNCSPTEPPDDAKHGYMQAVFEPCYVKGRLQMRLFPFAFLTLFVYTLCYPAFVAWIVFKVRCCVS